MPLVFTHFENKAFGLVVGLLLVAEAGECTTHQQQRHHTHTLVLPQQWKGTVSTVADKDNHTHHNPAHPTPGLPPSLQFTLLLPTTTLTPVPLGRRSVGEMAVMVSLALLAHQDLQGYQVLLEHPVWRQLTCAMSSHPLQTHPLL